MKKKQYLGILSIASRLISTSQIRLGYAKLKADTLVVSAFVNRQSAKHTTRAGALLEISTPGCYNIRPQNSMGVKQLF